MSIAEPTVGASWKVAFGGGIAALPARVWAPRSKRPFLTSLAKLLTAASLTFMGSACTRNDRAIEVTTPPVATASPHDGAKARDTPAHGKSVRVDISAFELVAMQDGVPVLRSRVIVGRPGTPTPELTSNLYAIKFNPAWSPTPAMIRNEGAHYMPPGPQNPLGRILFELDNDQLIYLHDTNDRSLFKREDRALSSRLRAGGGGSATCVLGPGCPVDHGGRNGFAPIYLLGRPAGADLRFASEHRLAPTPSPRSVVG